MEPAAAQGCREAPGHDHRHRPQQWVCPDGKFTWEIGDLQIRSDGLHFTPEGVQEWIAPWLVPQLANLALYGPHHRSRRLTLRGASGPGR